LPATAILHAFWAPRQFCYSVTPAIIGPRMPLQRSGEFLEVVL
jgi:hypothetical protein